MGYESLDQISGITDYDLKCDAVNFAKLWIDEDRKVIGNDKPLSILYIMKYSDGKIYQLLATKAPFKDPNSSETIGVFCQAIIINNKLITAFTKKFTEQHFKSSPKPAITLGNYYLNEHNENDIHLTEQQSTCLFYLLRGKTAKEIGRLLCKSPRTIEIHIVHLKQKFSCSRTTELIAKAITRGYLNYLPTTIFEHV